MSRVVNATLGAICTYHYYEGSQTSLAITIDKNHEVLDAAQNLLGFMQIASIEKSALTRRPSSRDYFIDDEGDAWQIGEMYKNTSTKWYFYIAEKGNG